MTSVYTWGYLAGTPEDLDAYVQALGAIVIDARLVPYSQREAWRSTGLRQRLGTNYQGVPDLGNVNYRTPGAPFVLRDQESGLARVRGMGRPMIVLCACRNHDTCHRSMVANLIARDMERVAGPGVYRMVHLPGKFSRWQREGPDATGGTPAVQGRLL